MTLSTIDDTTIDERKFVVALARGLDLLRAFRPGETMLGNRDFAERTGLPKATVNRLAYTLTVLGYLRYDETLGKYALDAGVLSLGYAVRKAITKAGGIDVANIVVRSKGGAISLEGTVPDQAQIDKAEEAAKSVKGVTSVSNKLTVQQQ
ncbi:BON domain-containing protein [Burkholderia cenocepacia]|uniref:BON domain-containing protein n=1 Tax=Burkholderia cenocepacia TaxID=95486 RepID=UPI00264F9F7F|nr:BON domain-containing protein [Burkholderia cenocepacia]MDN7542481.1 BON domain-containing protein [Burkholderia cenocepacia]